MAEYTWHEGIDQTQAGIAGTVRLRRGGLLVMAASALVMPRLLLLSGVGPRGREAENLPGQSRPAFAIDNWRVGVGLSGTPGGPFWTADFSAFVMLLDPKARGVVALDAKGNVNLRAINLPDTDDGVADVTLMTPAMFDLIALFAKNSALKIVFGPGSSSHPDLRPDLLADVRRYAPGVSPVDGVHFNRPRAGFEGRRSRTSRLQTGDVRGENRDEVPRQDRRRGLRRASPCEPRSQLSVRMA